MNCSIRIKIKLISQNRVEEPCQRIREYSILVHGQCKVMTKLRQKSNGNVIFDIMNEPNGIDAGVVAQLVCFHFYCCWIHLLILHPRTKRPLTVSVPLALLSSFSLKEHVSILGHFWHFYFIHSLVKAWTGAWTWESSGNAAAFTNIQDPQNNFAIQMHQYLDSDGSGTSDVCVSPTIGAERLQVATNWLKTNNLKGFLGEIGAGSNSACISAVQGALCAMQTSGVWIGALWWAAGPWWGDVSSCCFICHLL